MSKEFLDKILEISEEVLLDHMKSIYDMYSKCIANPSFSINIYKPLVLTIMNYYNSMFKSLILGDDMELTNKFKELQSYCNHKEICIVNLMFQLTVSFLHSVLGDHHKFNKDSREGYLEDIYDCIVKSESGRRGILMDNTNHECNSKNLDQCDPDKPLFSLKTGTTRDQ
jgi:hypothetical protein